MNTSPFQSSGSIPVFLTVVLSLLPTACGLLKNDRTQVSPEKTLELKNETLNAFTKPLKTPAGNELQVLASFPLSVLPDEVRNLPSGTELGTVLVHYEDETYAKAYDGDVIPEESNHTEESQWHVIFKKTDLKAAFLFRPEGEAMMRVIEKPVTVYSSPRAYCSKIHVPNSNYKKALFFTDQISACDPRGACLVNVHVDSVVKWDRVLPFPPQSEFFKGDCIETKTHYDVSELKTNRSVPRRADLRLNPGISKQLEVIQFDL